MFNFDHQHHYRYHHDRHGSYAILCLSLSQMCLTDVPCQSYGMGSKKEDHSCGCRSSGVFLLSGKRNRKDEEMVSLINERRLLILIMIVVQLCNRLEESHPQLLILLLLISITSNFSSPFLFKLSFFPLFLSR